MKNLNKKQSFTNFTIRKIRRLLALIVLAAAAAFNNSYGQCTAPAATVSAVKSGDWSSASTWSTGAIPASSSVVLIAGYTVTASSVPNVASIVINGGGELNYTGNDFTSSSDFYLNGGVLTMVMVDDKGNMGNTDVTLKGNICAYNSCITCSHDFNWDKNASVSLTNTMLTVNHDYHGGATVTGSNIKLSVDHDLQKADDFTGSEIAAWYVGHDVQGSTSGWPAESPAPLAGCTVTQSDLSVTAGHSGVFDVGSHAQTLNLQITNNGPNATNTPTTVTDTLPAGLTYAGTTGDQGNGWIISVSSNIVTAVYNGAVASGSNFPALAIPVNVDPGTAGQTVVNKVHVRNNTDYNLANNNSADNILIANPSGLPITFSSKLNATQQGNTVLLQWNTATEINNAGFYVQKSSDNATWTSLDFVATKAQGGNSNQILSYSYVDNEPTNGINYYRLQQEDNSGKKSYSTVTSITLGGINTSDITVYPNPVSSGNNVTLSFAQPAGGIAHIYNITGQAVKTFVVPQGATQYSVSTSGIASGLYFIKINKSTVKVIIR